MSAVDSKKMASLRSAIQISAGATGALHLAVRGITQVCEGAEPGEGMLAALEWLADFAAEATEAALAIADDVPARWRVLGDAEGVLAGLKAIPPVETTHSAGLA